MLNTSTNTFATDSTITTSFNDGHDYTAEIGAKMFRVMSDTLYQNKEGSVVREVVSNAQDAHNLVGTPTRPVEIHLPSTLAPFFSVKDYGPGLSDEEIKYVYTVLFLSTKENDPNQIGSFGLGAKSPFSLTDSFTVVSDYNGTKTTYIIMVKEDGVPTCITMGRAETEDANGIEVIIPANSDNMRRFTTEVRNQLRFFKTKPIIRNSPNFTWDEDFKVDIALTDFDILSVRSGAGDSYVVVGGVGYPLDFSQIEDKIPLKIAPFVDHIKNTTNAIIYCNISEIEVTPSREGLSYKKSTIDTLVAKFEAAAVEFYSTVSVRMDALPNNWERAKMVNSHGALMSGAVVASGNAHGIPIVNGVAAFRAIPTGMKHWIYSYRMVNTRTGNRRMTSTGLSTYSDITPTSDMLMVVADGSIATLSRIRHYLENNTNSHTIVYLIDCASEDASVRLTTVDTLFGGLVPTLAADLERPPRAARVAGGRGPNAKYFTLPMDEINYINNRGYYNDAVGALPIEEGGYYLVLGKNERSLDYPQCWINQAVTTIHGLGLEDENLYIFRANDGEKIKVSEKWVNLTETVAEFMVEFTKYQNKHWRCYQMRAYMNGSDLDFMEYIPEDVDDFEFRKLRHMMLLANKYGNKNYREYSHSFGSYVNARTTIDNKVDRIKDAINAKYPFLLSGIKAMDRRNVDDDIIRAHVTKYMTCANS